MYKMGEQSCDDQFWVINVEGIRLSSATSLTTNPFFDLNQNEASIREFTKIIVGPSVSRTDNVKEG